MLRNTAASRHGWAGVALRQRGPNPFAVGASVVVDAGPAAGRLFRVRTDGSYLSASDPRVIVGLGGYSGAVSATITWPDGATTRCALEAGRYHVCTR